MDLCVMMRWGILQRYVAGEVFRSFLLALTALTTILVLFVLVAQAAKAGLGPADMARLIPLIIPSTLPYTMPVALLFAVSVAYGRLAGDNEVIAVKACGLSVMTIIWPVFTMAGGMSLFLLFMTQDVIPRANHRLTLTLFGELESNFYKFLRKEREFDRQDWPFLIKVRDVLPDNTLLEPIFKHRVPGPVVDNEPKKFDLVVQAKSAKLKFDLEKRVARVHLVDSETQSYALGASGGDVSRALINDQVLELPLPDDFKNRIPPKQPQEQTSGELVANVHRYEHLMKTERAKHAISAGMWIASGRVNRVDWFHMRSVSLDYTYWQAEKAKAQTERYMRSAQAFGPLGFVLLGAPVGILFARRDFMSAFISCFLPIIILYYPLLLVGVNLGKEEILHPMYAMWLGNLLLAGLGLFVALPPVRKH
jgi:lipopolysaccharide export system permease protein